MSPRQPVTLTRGKVTVAFFALTISYVLGLVALNYEYNETKHLRERAAIAARHADIESCSRQKAIALTTYEFFAATINRSDKTLPTLAYYREHPRELQKALDLNATILADAQRRFQVKLVHGHARSSVNCQQLPNPATPSG